MSMVHSLARFIPHSFPSLNPQMLSYLTPDSPCLSVWSYFGCFSPHFCYLNPDVGWFNPILCCSNSKGLVESILIWLVVWKNEIYDFPYVGNFIIPTDWYFSEGVETTNQSFSAWNHHTFPPLIRCPQPPQVWWPPASAATPSSTPRIAAWAPPRA